jgi:hypothetical protein
MYNRKIEHDDIKHRTIATCANLIVLKAAPEMDLTDTDELEFHVERGSMVLHEGDKKVSQTVPPDDPDLSVPWEGDLDVSEL